MEYKNPDGPEIEWNSPEVVQEVRELMSRFDINFATAQIAYCSVLRNRMMGAPSAEPLIRLFPDTDELRRLHPQYFE